MDVESSYEEYRKYYLTESTPINEAVLDQINSGAELLSKWFDKPFSETNLSTPRDSRHSKLMHCYHDVPTLEGHGLEIAFSMGCSTIWLMDRYPNITLDSMDFQPCFKKLIPYFKELYGNRIKEFWIGSAHTTGKPAGHYDFINSASVWEHLTEDIYWKVLRECHRVLKPEGKLYLFVDPGPNDGEEHIRCVPLNQTVAEMRVAGFENITPFVYRKI
jgi:hypothetical protein